MDLIKLEETMTSREITELTGKRHDHTIRDIRNEIEKLENAGISTQLIFGEGSYLDKQNQKRPQYIISKDGIMMLAMKYDTVTRYKITQKLKELENAKKIKDSSEWKIARSNGKLMRRKETDIIQERLIPLAISQGSKNYSKLYMTYSRLVNSSCGVLANTRAEMTPEMLIYIGFLESMIENCIIEEVEKETNYKEIYQICKIKCEQLKVIKSVPKLKYINQEKILGISNTTIY